MLDNSNSEKAGHRTFRCSPATLASLLKVSEQDLPSACDKALEEDPSTAFARPAFYMVAIPKREAMEQALARPSFEASEVLDKALLLALFGGSEHGLYNPNAPLHFSKESFLDVLYFPEEELYPRRN